MYMLSIKVLVECVICVGNVIEGTTPELTSKSISACTVLFSIFVRSVFWSVPSNRYLFSDLIFSIVSGTQLQNKSSDVPGIPYISPNTTDFPLSFNLTNMLSNKPSWKIDHLLQLHTHHFVCIY